MRRPETFWQRSAVDTGIAFGPEVRPSQAQRRRGWLTQSYGHGEIHLSLLEGVEELENSLERRSRVAARLLAFLAAADSDRARCSACPR